MVLDPVCVKGVRVAPGTQCTCTSKSRLLPSALLSKSEVMWERNFYIRSTFHHWLLFSAHALFVASSRSSHLEFVSDEMSDPL